MNWFEAITGFPEVSYAETQKRLRVEDGRLSSDASTKKYSVGVLETPSLSDLRTRTAGLEFNGSTTVSLVQGDARKLHADPLNERALFQVASQFNLLEMVGPGFSPEDGVTRYESDRTQGPACAIAAGAATIFRNYFVDLAGDRQGQTAEQQIDCLRDLGNALGNIGGSLWMMRNGYALLTREQLFTVDHLLASATETELDRLRSLMRIGLHWDVGLTDVEPGPTVSQAFCSALPVSYNRIRDEKLWRRFATLILEAAYEATLRAGLLNASRGNSNLVFLTRLGGGAFGNQATWIDGAIANALTQSRSWGLNVRIVSYGTPDRGLCELVRQFEEGS